MAKKLSLLIAAVAVLAFAVPAMASAAAPLTESGGTVVVPVGSGITGTSTNAKTKTSLGTLSCKKVVLKGKVTANEEGKAEGTSSEEFTGAECEVEGTSVPVKNIKLENLKTGTKLGFTTGNGTASFSFVSILPIGECKFTGTNAPGTYSTTSMTNILKFTNASLTASPTACGPASLSGEFALTTSSNGTAVEIT